MVYETLLCSLVPESFPRGLLCRPAHASSVFVLNMAERRGSPSGGGVGGRKRPLFQILYLKGAFTSYTLPAN